MKEQILSQAPRWHLAVQLLVELSKLLQETIVWWDVPVGADTFDGVRQRHVLVDHQVGQDQGGRAAETHRTVDEHLTCRLARNKNHNVTSCGPVKKTQPSSLPAPFPYLQPCNDRIIAVNFILMSNLLLLCGLKSVHITESGTSNSWLKKFPTMLQQMFLHTVIPASLSAPED